MQTTHYDIAIIGAGFAGLGMAIRLKKAGYDSFVVFERGSEVGGTWRDNTYPGCGCDVASHLYSFSFEPNPNWTRRFSKQPEILEYLKDCVRKNHLEPHLRLNTEVFSAIFNEQEGFYSVTDSTGNQITARMIVAGLGPLNRPKIPDFKGIEHFKGTIFHSSRWNHAYDLTNKRVAVIGTGASAIQFIPEIADKVQQLYVFQRTAPWIIPKPDGAFSGFAKTVFQKIPFIRKTYREILFWINEFLGLSFIGNETIKKLAQFQATLHLKNQVKDAVLREKLMPNYRIGCKRVLVSDNYYPSIQKPNVELIKGEVQAFTDSGVIDSSGNQYEVDTVILGTGFYAAEYPQEFTKNYTIQGLNGRELLQQWAENGFEAFRGTTVNGFPNLCLILGPNTGLGHNSVVHIMESQINYIMDYYERIRKNGGKTYFDVKDTAQKTYNQQIQVMLKKTAWTSGCASWYMNSAGKNTTIYPRLNTRFRKETLRVDWENYEPIVPQLVD
ncbi:MAG: NAD(P)/FAD-dependent oxidoreductase [Arcicella sp.]|nr:NAD(P)/FAD-dependent oxidoreductase [Arcicella sp.]